MIQTIPEKFYTQFSDETWTEAVEAHSVGFDSIEDAIEEANFEPKQVEFVVKDWKGKVVYKGITKGWQYDPN